MGLLMKILSILSLCLILSGCLFGGGKQLNQTAVAYNNLPKLGSFGGNDGEIVIGYVNRWSDKKIRPTELPIAVNETKKGRASGVYNLRDFYEDHPNNSSIPRLPNKAA